MTYPKLVATLFLGIFFSINSINSASAYVFSFTNGTSSDIKVDICGIAKIGCSMMQGTTPAYSYFSDDQYGKTRRVNNAGHLKGPQDLAPGETVELNFNSFWDIGFCANLSQVKVGVEGNGIVPRKVTRLPNEYYDELFKAIDKFGDDFAALGDKYAVLAGQYGPAVKAGFSSFSLISAITNLVRHSTCTDMHFLVLPEKDSSKGISVVTGNL
jgi:hypothetical protein